MDRIFTEDKIYGNDTFYEYIKKKKIGIWGCGYGKEKVEELIALLNINVYKYFDKDKNKHNEMIFAPDYIWQNKKLNWFIIISNSYYEEIKKELEGHGFKEYYDFINGLYIKNELYYLKYKANMVPDLNFSDLTFIENEMKAEKLNIKNILVDTDKVKYIENKYNLAQTYNKKTNKRYYRKILEYYFVYELLGLEKCKKSDIYIDVGACSSPWSKQLREIDKINAYSIDLDIDEKFADLDYYIKEDATKTNFSDNSVFGMSLQSSYEMFMYNNDIEFIRECSRILREGGKAIILPLYMHKEFLNTASPQYYKKGYSDVGAKEYIRNDASSIRMARFYDVKTLKNRVIKEIERCGLGYSIYILNNEIVEKDGFVYLKFILEIEK